MGQVLWEVVRGWRGCRSSDWSPLHLICPPSSMVPVLEMHFSPRPSLLFRVDIYLHIYYCLQLEFRIAAGPIYVMWIIIIRYVLDIYLQLHHATQCSVPEPRQREPLILIRRQNKVTFAIISCKMFAGTRDTISWCAVFSGDVSGGLTDGRHWPGITSPCSHSYSDTNIALHVLWFLFSVRAYIFIGPLYV